MRGSDDPPIDFGMAGYADAVALAAGIPRSELVVIPGAGHSANLEAPEQFNAELRRFLRSASSDSAGG